MKILYKFASRSRPQKFFEALENIRNMAQHDDYLILCSLDLDDESMNNEQVREILGHQAKVKAVWGYSKNKIDAINRDVNECDYQWDILCNHSDDMWFIKKGFDLDIIEGFNGFDGLLHFPDQRASDRLCTYAMLSRSYYLTDGHIYDPSFISVYADNFQQDLAIHRSRYKFVNKTILEHRHPCWGFGLPDEQLLKTEHPSIYNKDRITYETLKFDHAIKSHGN